MIRQMNTLDAPNVLVAYKQSPRRLSVWCIINRRLLRPRRATHSSGRLRDNGFIGIQNSKRGKARSNSMHAKEPKCSRRRLRNHVTASPGLADGIPQNDDWNPIGGTRAPEYVPGVWTGPHVGLRLVEAFMTMANMPMTGIGASVVGFWPRYSYTWEDLLAQQESDDLLKADTANKANSAKIRPTAQEVSRMEQAISWPGRYCQQVSIARIVQRVAHYRSRDIDMSIVAKKMKQDRKVLRTRNRIGLDLIADGLQRDHVRVF